MNGDRTLPPKVQEIYQRIWLAIVHRRLRPGSRLKEEELAELFAVSRARIRQGLAALERDGLVSHAPNRGACISEPSADEASDTFFARAAIELRLVERLCTRATPAAIARLRAHVAAERRAHAHGDADAIVRLSGQFHLLVAELVEARFPGEVLRMLIARTSLITAMYQPMQVQACGPDEHAAIVAAIAAGDGARARRLMAAHLDHLQAGLERAPRGPASSDIRHALAP